MSLVKLVELIIISFSRLLSRKLITCISVLYLYIRCLIFEPIDLTRSHLALQEKCFTSLRGFLDINPACTMLVKRNATLIYEFFVSSLEEVDVELCSKLSPLIQGGHRKFLIQSCISYDQHCMYLAECKWRQCIKSFSCKIHGKRSQCVLYGRPNILRTALFHVTWTSSVFLSLSTQAWLP